MLHTCFPLDAACWGQMPLACWRCCPRRRSWLLDPAPAEPIAGLVALNPPTSGEDSDSSVPGRINREVVLVAPTSAGCYFGHEGLLPSAVNPGTISWICVWKVPGVGPWRISGIHWGRGDTVEKGLYFLHQGRSSLPLLQHCANQEEATQVFIRGARNYGLSPRFGRRVFGWSFNYDLEGGQPRLSAVGSQLRSA